MLAMRALTRIALRIKMATNASLQRSMAEEAAQGLHLRNGTIAVVVRVESYDNEYPALTKLRAKFRGIEFLRWHFPDLSKDFSASCRVLVCNRSDSDDQYVAVLSFALKDIQQGEQNERQ